MPEAGDTISFCCAEFAQALKSKNNAVFFKSDRYYLKMGNISTLNEKKKIEEMFKTYRMKHPEANLPDFPSHRRLMLLYHPMTFCPFCGKSLKCYSRTIKQ